MDLISLPADLKQNIFYMVYFIVKHNFLAIIFAVLAILSAILAILRPSRSGILMFLGFLILLLSFEYIKHIKEPLRDQTIGSLITIQPHNKVTRIVNFALNKAIPLLLPLTGITLILISIFSLWQNKKNKKK